MPMGRIDCANRETHGVTPGIIAVRRLFDLNVSRLSVPLPEQFTADTPV
ncbi:MAG: hypothetical protein JWQ50_7541 [Caballeronia mineralivorans]|jgi:hypothetical protein|nr:hypothetical protein [Caballeronia mineralivorans]MEA3096480.1 hypothetical protein [Caballeronia mineralivorans]MEA3159514.1 hypothetical protein [Gammaproteobacteria bacterium]